MLKNLTLRSAVEFAVETEKAGGLFYRKMAKRFEDDAELVTVLNDLADEEDHHEARFRALLKQVPKEPFLKSEREKLAVLRAISMSEFFLGDTGIYKKLDEIKTPEDVYRRAFQLEKDTLMYYLEMRQILGDNDVLDSIIESEERHVLAFSDRLEDK